ncbi:ArnT family glycosyltransferase [Dyella sp. 20L07]|uniref:ArnT family glycosyltransferase n=1 Tax=Dyella sp. 20L07 TaxID=3384240 RepID=UPI003D2DD7AD
MPFSSARQILQWIPPSLWILLLLPLLAVLPPVPIDETRYLSVAWEMRQTGSWITLHLNGVPYFDKPPLLFWLVNAGWSVLGISLWSARVVVLLCSAACIALCGRLDRLLTPGESPMASWLLLGSLFLVLFSGVVMFDITLCLFVLLGFVAIVSYVQTGVRSALLLLFAAAALGMLAKGPVALLHLAGPMMTAPWWSAGERRASWRKVWMMLLVAVLGGLPVLLWAWAAVHHLGATDAHELLLRQTAGRVVESFAHNRSLWWYLPWLPVLLLPWTLLLRWRRVPDAWRTWHSSSAARFGLSASLPALLAFCVVSGKQLHYLLPLLPGVAIVMAAWIRRDPSLLSIRRLWMLAVLIAGVWLWAMFGAEPLGRGSMPRTTVRWLYVLSGLLLALSAVYLWLSNGERVDRRAAFGTLLLSMAILPLVRLQALGAFDAQDIAQRVAELHAQGVPMARTDNEPGLITFLARLPTPLPGAGDQVVWARHHPDGVLLVYSGRGTAPGNVDHSVRLANGWVALMSSQEVLADPEALSR